MREVFFDDGTRVVKSPWLRIAEAAAYCGISRSMFEERAGQVPHGGNSRTRLYHTGVLDRWLEGLLDVPFDPPLVKRRRRTFRYRPEEDEKFTLVNPVTGKVF
ncbi:MAG: helix-turn-helix domain-containing protein [Pseudomonadota bacterium]